VTPNPFVVRGAAARYARHRPDVTGPVLGVLGRVVRSPVDLALDVGCGTGQSTRALRSLARRVVGIDVSAEMVEAATPADCVEYRVGEAEDLPLAASACDLVAAGLAMHWFDRDRFLSEAHRVLRPGGVLAVWNAGWAGHGEPGAAAWTWFREAYPRAFPAPRRDGRDLADADARAAGFEPVLRERIHLLVEFDAEGFVGFLSTQSAVLATVGHDEAALAVAIARLRTETEGFFPDGPTAWRFEGWVAAFRRAAG
jgi:SAM-dependent methyltransferase